jgi:glutamine synthetase
MTQRRENRRSPTGVQRPDEAARLIEHVETHGVRFINLEFSDVVGMAKAVTIPADQLADTLEHGKWFDGSSIESFARVAETDMYLRPDPATYAEVPWRASIEATNSAARESERVARLICDVLLPSGERFAGDPRAALFNALAAAEALGYRYVVAPELEFFLLQGSEGAARAPLPHDRGGYFDLSTDLAADVRREIVAELAHMDIGIETSHHEVAAGQHEIDFTPGDALRIADAVVTARYAIKAIAQRRGLWATFLPKPFYGVNGSGMHTHQQLVRRDTGADAFSDPADTQYGLSTVGRQFIAGQLAHAKGMSAVVAPLVNSYKRFVTGYEAPVMISWGRVNREALVRVPRVAPGQSQSVRVELRSPDPSCNPYLAFTAMLRAALAGIQHELRLDAPVEEGLYALEEQDRLRRGIGLLPTSLGDALDQLRGDDVVREALGEQIAAWLLEAKEREWKEYRTLVHPWELERYLPQF